jgi:hypothetical protein
MKTHIRSIAIRFAVCAALSALTGCGGDKDTGDDDDDNAGDDDQGGSGGKTAMPGKECRRSGEAGRMR